MSISVEVTPRWSPRTRDTASATQGPSELASMKFIKAMPSSTTGNEGAKRNSA